MFEAIKAREFHLVLTPEEAEWLRDFAQNGPPDETADCHAMRAQLFGLLDAALKGKPLPIHTTN